MRVDAVAGLPNSWSSWLWIRELSDPLLSVWPFLHAQKSFFFPLSFSFYQEKLAKSILLNASDDHENSFLNRCAIKYCAISHGHIGDGYREIQETGVHRGICRPSRGCPDGERIYVLGLEITYLLMYFWTWATPRRFPSKRFCTIASNPVKNQSLFFFPLILFSLNGRHHELSSADAS